MKLKGTLKRELRNRNARFKAIGIRKRAREGEIAALTITAFWRADHNGVIVQRYLFGVL